MTSFIGNAPNQVPTNGDLGTAAFVEASSLATLTDTQTLTNKTISGVDNTLTNVSLTTAVTGTLPAANGGTGLATLTANNLLAGNGTGTVNLIAPSTSGNIIRSNGTAFESVAPIATQSEAETGTNNTQYMTPLRSAQVGFGRNQTLQNVTASRAFSTTYTNSTSRPIQVIVGANQSGSGSQTISVSIDGGAAIVVAQSIPNTGGFPSITATFTVGIGQTYNVTRNGGSLAFWTELS
jgi:hypothetical protein